MAHAAPCTSRLGALSSASAFHGAVTQISAASSSKSGFNGLSLRAPLSKCTCQRRQPATFRALCRGDGDERRSGAVQKVLTSAAAAALSVAMLAGGVSPAEARPAGVNRPELLPKRFTPVIDVAGFLSEGQEKRLEKDLKRLEDDTGYKLRVLAQNYPETPGLAVRDYWKVDDRSIVFVADPSLGGNILNFNVGTEVDLNVPKSFWSRLSGKYGNKFFWQEKGEDASIEAAVIAIDACLREPPGPRACANIR